MRQPREFKKIEKAMITPIESHLKVNTSEENEPLLITKSANEWLEIAKKEPRPSRLLGNLWYEGELAFLTADTNVGKSIFAVQIGECIARGMNFHIQLPCEAKPQPVIYCDFELTYKQFENRYSNEFDDHYEFSEYFYRVEMNSEFTKLTDFDSQLIEMLEHEIIKYNAKIVIIDNLSYLRTESMDTAKAALPLMQLLKNLKKKHNLSLLVLTHTPKRSMYLPVTRNDIAGSKQLANFSDSIFAIAHSIQGKNIRYIKQLKTRVTGEVFHEMNVLECQIEKENNFTRLIIRGVGCERDHLMKPLGKSDLEEKVLSIKSEKPNASLREIAEEAGTNHTQVMRILNKKQLDSKE